MEALLQELEQRIQETTTKVTLLEEEEAWGGGGERDNSINTKKRPPSPLPSPSPSPSPSHENNSQNTHKRRRRRASNFDELARRFFTRNEQLAMTSVIGSSGDRNNGFCSNGCRSKVDGRHKLGQRNMVIRRAGTSEVTLGKWCYKCIAESSIRTKRIAPDEDGRGGGGYVCTKAECQEEGVGAQVDKDDDGCVMAETLTCGCMW